MKLRSSPARSIALNLCLLVAAPAVFAVEAPVGNLSQTNGYLSQADFEAALRIYQKDETPQTGLGPVFNDSSCAKCHRQPILGGESQIRAVRAGRFDGVKFIEPIGGSLIPSRSIHPQIRAIVPSDANVQTFRVSLSTLGDGYVEAVPDQVFIELAQNQFNASGGVIRGAVNRVAILERQGATAVGRFGWKAQHASLFSFAVEAYRDEIGITTPLLPNELTSNGRSVDPFEPPGFFSARANRTTLTDVESVTAVTRSTLARPRAPNSPALGVVQGQLPRGRAGTIKAGEQVFRNTGCVICHVDTLTTGAVGSLVNGGAYAIPPALASLSFHPFGDYLLHDIGSGDGIVQGGDPSTRQKIRTAPLWGLSRRQAFMHDGQTTSVVGAVERHTGEAVQVMERYRALSATDQANLLAFLQSL